MAEEGKFLFISGHPTLDFLNTEIMRNGAPADLLESPGDLAYWLVDAGETHEKVTAETLAQAKALRAALRRVVVAGTRRENAPPDALTTINDALSAGHEQRELQQAEPGKFIAQTRRAGGPLFFLAEAGLDLLCHHDLQLARQCESPQCILWFLDSTKNHKRRWCRMGVCGNREKAAAHYRRSKEGK